MAVIASILSWEGGFGEVWRGYDPHLKRHVAIKVARPNCSPDRATRLREEAHKVAQLEHPGIVPVYDTGTDGSYSYIVSQLIDGPSLAQLIKEDRLPYERAVEIVVAVAEAVHYAHLNGIIHRDIKPANILLDKEGQPHLTDFGCAATEDDLLEQEGVVAGTRSYMAPEQIRGESNRITSRTDVYSLGVLLYTLLTGRVPFEARKLRALTKQILAGEPRPPRTIVDSIPSHLEAVCLKALQKEPGDRYATAKDLARELRKPSTIGRRNLWISLSVIAVLLIGATAVQVWLEPSEPAVVRQMEFFIRQDVSG